jgi:hypothetical protein
MMALRRQVQCRQILSIPHRYIGPILHQKSHRFHDGVSALRRQMQGCLSFLIPIPTRPLQIRALCQCLEGSA